MQNAQNVFESIQGHHRMQGQPEALAPSRPADQITSGNASPMPIVPVRLSVRIMEDTVAAR